MIDDKRIEKIRKRYEAALWLLSEVVNRDCDLATYEALMDSAQDIPCLLSELAARDAQIEELKRGLEWETRRNSVHRRELLEIMHKMNANHENTKQERDAALRDIDCTCGNCSFFKPGHQNFTRPCGHTCESPYEYHHRVACDGWEWRGPGEQA